MHPHDVEAATALADHVRLRSGQPPAVDHIASVRDSGSAENPSFLGWAPAGDGSTLGPMTSTTPTTFTSSDQRERNKKLVDDYIQALFTKGDLGAVDRYLHADYLDHDQSFPGAPQGAEGIRRAAAMIRTACPDWHSAVHQLIAEDDLVVERFTASGTHRGELFGVPGTGRTLVLHGIQIFRVDGERIVERWAQLDWLGVLRQLGLAPG